MTSPSSAETDPVRDILEGISSDVGLLWQAVDDEDPKAELRSRIYDIRKAVELLLSSLSIKARETEALARFVNCTCHDDASRRLCLKKDRCTVIEAYSVAPPKGNAEGVKPFAKELIRASWEGCDGGDIIQEAAVRHGLIKQVPFDPAIHDDEDGIAVEGDSWFVSIDAAFALTPISGEVAEGQVAIARQIIANGIRPSIIHGKVMVAIPDSVVREALVAALATTNPSTNEKGTDSGVAE